ncbi:MAG: glycerophosphodiester phosphodiesterase family protein, partial [Leptospirales bacterium]
MQNSNGSNSASREFEDRIYPEFHDYSGREILIRLDALDNLLNQELESEYHKAGLALEEQEEKARAESEAAVQSLEKQSPAPVAGRDAKSKQGDPFLVIAHRGWSGSYPENTLIGMREAIKLGCHMIEFDVTLSADRRPIIIHDDTLSRTTNGCGQVGDLSYRELRKLDAGSWFHPKYMGARLPSLDEILLISRGSGIMVNIEIK